MKIQVIYCTADGPLYWHWDDDTNEATFNFATVEEAFAEVRAQRTNDCAILILPYEIRGEALWR